MNKVILSGRFTREPEQRMMSNQTEFSRFSLACQSSFVNKNGERETEFINCVAFGKTAETINRYCKKGAMIVAQGRIKNSSYDAQDGTKRYTTDVVIENFEFVGGAQNKNEQAQVQNTPVSQPVTVSDPYSDFANEVTISADDLPF
jgi:single-strand DNA-binding protein